MTSDDNPINRAMRDAFGNKFDLAECKAVGSGISETRRMALDVLDDPGRRQNLPLPWTENRDMIVRLFTDAFKRSFLCPGRDSDQCCKASGGGVCIPNWREREDPEWYAQEINKYLTVVDGRIRQGITLAPALVADDGFELGSLFTEAVIKFKWDKHAKRGKKIVEGARSGAEMRRGANLARRSAADTVIAVDALLKEGKSPMDAYRKVAREQRVSEQTIRKQYGAAKKQR